MLLFNPVVLVAIRLTNRPVIGVHLSAHQRFAHSLNSVEGDVGTRACLRIRCEGDSRRSGWNHHLNDDRYRCVEWRKTVLNSVLNGSLRKKGTPALLDSLHNWLQLTLHVENRIVHSRETRCLQIFCHTTRAYSK